jgi:predicted RNA methylase
MKRRDLVEFLERVPAFPSPSYELEQYKTSAALAADVLCAISAQFGGLEGCCVADLGCGTGILSLGCVALGASFVLGLDVDGAALASAAEAAEELGVSESLDLVLADIGAIGAALDAQGNASPIVLSALEKVAAAAPPAATIAAATAAGHSLESPGTAAECEGGAQEGGCSASSPDAAAASAASAASAAALRAMLTRWGGRFDTVVMNPPFGTRLPGVDVAFLKVALALVRPLPGGLQAKLWRSSSSPSLPPTPFTGRSSWMWQWTCCDCRGGVEGKAAQ